MGVHRGAIGRAAAFAAARVVVCACAAGCSGEPRVAPRPAHGGIAHRHEARARSAAPLWSYEVTVSPDLEQLTVDATIGAAGGAQLVVDDDADRFVVGLEIADAGRFRQAHRGDGCWDEPACEQGCRVRYRFRLGDAARTFDDRERAEWLDGAVVAPASTWLVRPAEAPPGARYRFHVSSAPAMRFETGVFPAPDGAPDTYESDAADIVEPPYAAFGALRVVPPGDARWVHLVSLPGSLDAGDAALRAWTDIAAEVVSDYYGRAPIDRALVLVAPTSGRSVSYSTTLGDGGAAIYAPVGRHTTADQLARDWQITHEMLHLAFPTVPREQAWLQEGIATYVEPIARARLGRLDVREAWERLAHGLPFGLPGAGDRGLNRTHTWGRTYWGGALFCLLADVAIRERTAGTHSLDDALRAVLDRGGTIAVHWDVDRVLDIADRAVGVPVLRELYDRMAVVEPGAATVGRAELDDALHRLGVVRRWGAISFDEAAPLAGIRRAITARRSPP